MALEKYDKIIFRRVSDRKNVLNEVPKLPLLCRLFSYQPVGILLMLENCFFCYLANYREGQVCILPFYPRAKLVCKD